MVPVTTLVAIVATLVVTLAGPVVLAIVGVRRWGLPVAGLVAGVITFGATQLLFRIPLLQVASGTVWFENMRASLIVLAMFLSLTAGLVEELGRFVAFRFPLRRRLNWQMGLALGIGHGGFESMILVGMMYVNNLVYSLMINTGTFDSLMAPLLGPMAAEVKEALIETPATLFLAAGGERVLTIVIHIALSLLVLYGVKVGQFRWVALAIVAHTVVNLGAVLLVGHGYSVWLAQAWVVLLAVAGGIYIARSRRVWGS